MSINLKCLVLNSNYMPVSLWPLYTIPVEDAIVRYFKETCHVVLWHDRRILTPSRKDLYWPSVIVNPNQKNMQKSEAKLKKMTLYYRDHCRCSHCLNDLTLNTITYEHVVPTSKGGEHSWDNVVASCKDCNSRKGNADPVGKWKPKITPYTPTYFDILESRRKFPIIVDDPRWEQFLPKWQGEVIVRNK